MSKFIQDFKAFAMRGNVIDMAVGVIIGGAFGKIVSSVVDDLIMPVISAIIGDTNFSDLKITLKDAVTAADGTVKEAVTFNYGNFIQTTIDFLIIAFCIFLLVKFIARLHKQKEEAPAAPPAPSEEAVLLKEIRDLLKEEKDKA